MEQHAQRKKPVVGGLGQNAQRINLTFRPKEMLLYLHNCFFFSFHSLYFAASVIHPLLFMRSYFVFSCVSSGFKNSLRSSSNLLLGLPTCLRVLMLVSSLGCQSKILCHSPRQSSVFQSSMEFFVFPYFPSASLVHLFMYSMQSSSFSVASISSSTFS